MSIHQARQYRNTMRRTLIAVLLVTAGLLGSCATKNSADSIPDSRKWLIESYDHGTITVKNDGKTYKGTCEGHRILGPDQLVYDVVPSFPCTMVIDAVGQSIQPTTLNTDFHIPILVMGHGPVGELVLRRGDMIEMFVVVSVMKTDQ
jgi:hypothetical protein